MTAPWVESKEPWHDPPNTPINLPPGNTVVWDEIDFLVWRAGGANTPVRDFLATIEGPAPTVGDWENYFRAKFPGLSDEQYREDAQAAFTNAPPSDFMGITPKRESRILHIDAYRLTVPANVQWVAEPFVYAGGVTMLSAPPKAGKSTLIAQLQMARENNETFLGATVAQGPSLLITEEGGYAVTYKIGDLHNTYVYDRKAAAGETFDQTLDEAAGWMGEHPDGLVIIDTLAIWAGIDDENDASKTTQAVAKVMLLAQKTNAPVVIIHHSRKSGGSHGEAIRGSGAILATVDISLELKRTSDKESDDRYLDMQGRVLLPERYLLTFDRDLRRYTKSDADDRRDADIESQLSGIPISGEGVDRAWLAGHWDIRDPRDKIKHLVNVGRLRERKTEKPGGGAKYLYWAIPPVERTPHFEDFDED